jgi:phage N-6-adenine-methyltransferase
MTTATATRLFDNIIELPSLTQEGGKSNEWYTPARYIEAAREVMGGIDLDPASCEIANQVVKAKRYYTKEDNGLTQEWTGNIWLNPPYSSECSPTGREGSRQGLAKPFIFKLIREYEQGNITEAVLLITSDTDASWFMPLWNYPICFADHKVMFHRPGRSNEGQFFGTSFVYLGPNEAKFIEVFSQFGTIAKRVSPPVVKPVNLSLWEEV